MSAPSEAASGRLDTAYDVLRRHGLPQCSARAAGVDGEVLLLGPVGHEEAWLFGPGAEPLLAELRAAGFRYVALDLAPSEGVAS